MPEGPSIVILKEAVKQFRNKKVLLVGGNTKLANPQGGLAFSLAGTDGAQLTIPPSPRLASAERAGEMVEDYWMALARDVPFSQYGKEPITAAAIAELNALSDFRGPRVNGQVTAASLFRGFTPGDLVGPYMSLKNRVVAMQKFKRQ